MSLSETFLVSPLSVSGCQLWLDAADPNGNGNIPANGTSISTWVDKSGNNNNASGGIAPIYSSRTIVFNGTTQNLILPNISSFPSNETWFVVFNFTGSGTNRGWNLLGSSAVTGGRGMQIYRVTSDYNFGPDKWGTGTFAFGPILQNTTYIGTSVYSGGPTNGIFNVYINGTITPLSPQTTSFSGTGITNLGVGSSSTFFWQGSMAEVLYYPLALTTSQREKIEGYLAWKWGLTANLPSNHPYKNSRPLDGIQLPTSLLVPSRPLRNVFVFNPTVVSNCVLWLDAADISTMFQDSAGAIPARTTGSTVSLWKDKSPSGNHASNTTAQPTLTIGAQNGLNVLNFNGAQYLTLSTNTLPTGSTNCTFFFITRTPSTSVQVFFTYGQNPNTINRNPQFYYNSGRLNIDLYGGGLLSDNTIFTNSYVMTSCTFTNRITAWDNGTQFSGGSTAITLNTGTGWASIGVGRVPPGTALNYYFNGQMGEMILFNRELSSQERLQMEGYLAWKWGLETNLPTSHLQKTNPPDLPAEAPRGIPQLKEALFTPRNISGNQLWLDANDPNGNGIISSIGSVMTQWVDKSGSGNTVVASGSPLFSNYNSRNAVYINSNWFSKSAVFPIANTTIFFVMSIANPINDKSYFQMGANPNSGNGDSTTFFSDVNVTRPGGIGSGRLYYGDGGGNQMTLSFATATATDVVPFCIQTAKITSQPLVQNYINGILRNQKIGTKTRVNQSGLIVGSSNGGWQWTGYFSEIIVYNSALSTANQQKIEGYLAWKWGLQANLPSTHPFKLFPPSP